MRLKCSKFLFFLFRISIPACFLLGSFSGSFSQTQWVSEYNQEGIEIFTRVPAGNSLKEFKAVTQMKTNLQTLMAVMIDPESHVKWMDGISGCKLIRQVNSQERILYYLIPFPWPMSNRDLVLRSSFFQEKITKALVVNIKSEPGAYPMTENVRVQIAEGSWKFLPLPDGMIEVSYQFFSDPAGMPAWIVNMFILNTPVKTLKNLKEIVKSTAYQGGKFDWLF